MVSKEQTIMQKDDKNEELNEKQSEILRLLSSEFSIDIVNLMKNFYEINQDPYEYYQEKSINVIKELQKEHEKKQKFLIQQPNQEAQFIPVLPPQIPPILQNLQIRAPQIPQPRNIQSSTKLMQNSVIKNELIQRLRVGAPSCKLNQSDIGISGSAVFWGIQNFDLAKERDVQEIKNRLPWVPGDLDLLCLSYDQQIALPMRFLEKNGYKYASRSQFYQKELNAILLQKFKQFRNRNKFSISRFTVFNFENSETGKQIQIILNDKNIIRSDFLELENFLRIEKPILKPSHKILQIRKGYGLPIFQKRFSKYHQRGYQIYHEKIIKMTIMKCYLLKKRLQKGKFTEKRINDYISEIIFDYYCHNYLPQLKELVKNCSFKQIQQMVQQKHVLFKKMEKYWWGDMSQYLYQIKQIYKIGNQEALLDINNIPVALKMLCFMIV